MNLDPSKDGIDHINIYSKGATKLGRLLTNFSAIGFTHPEYGRFSSMEGFWYWLSTGKVNDQLKTLVGFEAKKLGRTLPKVNVDDFNEQIKKAISLRFEQNESFKKLFTASTLPFHHYYWYGTPDSYKVYDVKEVAWLTEYISELRHLYQTTLS